MKKLLIAGMVGALALAVNVHAADPTVIGQSFTEIANLTLTDAAGKAHKLAELKGRDEMLVLAFVTPNCPWSMARHGKLQAVADAYAAKGVKLIGISSNKSDKLADVIAKVKASGGKFPIYRDEGKALATALKAKATPHTFIFDQGGALRFAGAMDDGKTDGSAAQHQFAAEALEALLAGKAVADPTPKAMIGCNIK